MSRKTQKCYEALFDFIGDRKIIDLKGTKTFITNNELAVRNALKLKFPLSKLSACQFHLAQAVHKNASKINGFFNYIRHCDDASNIYYKLMNLALLPPHDIDPTYKLLEERARELKNPKLDVFIEYFRRQWIIKEGANKISVFGDEPRTTSGAEGYNRNLNSYCQKKQSFFWCCASIRNQEFMKSKEFATFVESGGLRGCNKKTKDKVSSFKVVREKSG